MRATSRRSGALRRSTVALVIALVALLLAAGAALAPARKLQGHYSWPPRVLPAEQPARTWYAPLLLARHTPESITAHLPCGGRPLADAPRPVVVLATGRDARAPNRLAVTQDGRRLSVTIGGANLVHVTEPGTRCEYTLQLADGSWALTGGSGSVSKNGTAPMPDVDGLFTNLDLRSGPRPAVDITTAVYGTRTTLGQTLARILAVLAAVAALVLVVARSGAWPSVRRPPVPQPVDVVVILLLVVWWVIGPAYFDDGWIMAGEHNFLATGNFSAYYDSFGVSSSLQYWLLWVQHWLFDASNALVVLRLPALLCLVATWILCRWILGRTAAASSRPAVWALASMFSIGALAWGMTLRPEPVVALLILGVVAGTVRFVERGTTAPLAVCAVLIALAVSAHPAGLLALSPLLMVAPRVFAWARPRLTTAATIVVAALALGAVLAFLGSDVTQLHSNVTSLRAHGAETAGWRDELTRYELLSRPFYGAPLRRAWVAVALLTVLGYVLRRRRGQADSLLDLFAPALGIAFVLLIVTPAKIPWHFGALIGLAAVAVAAETARLAAARRTGGWHVRPFIVIGAAMVAAAWSWFPRNAWSDLDLRTLGWTLGVEQRVTFAKLAGLLPLLVLAAFVLASRGRRADDAVWRAAAWTAPILAVPLIAFTVGVLVADAKKTNGWTLTRQNVDALRNDLRCGLADDAVLPALASMRGLPSVGSRQRGEAGELPAAPVGNVPRFVLGPAPARSPWFRLPARARMGFFVTGAPGASDSLRIEWGRERNGSVQPLGGGGIADAALTDPSPELVVWRFFPAGSLPSRPSGADAVRIAVESGVAPGGSIGITAPVSYGDESLARGLARNVPSLALPNLLAYVPCITQPALQGTVGVPKLVVAQQGTLWPIGTGTSPFDGLPRLYNLVRLPLTDSPHPPGDVAIYQVDEHIPGGVLAPVS